MRRPLSLFLQTAAQVFVVGTCVRAHVVDWNIVSGPSMLPTFNVAGDVVLVDRASFSLRGRRVRRGEIVVLRDPDAPGRALCKRVAAVEGDLVPASSLASEAPRVPTGHIWVLGDNPAASRDSRSFGAVPEALVVSRPFWRVLPISRFGPVS